jgi:glycosyltransferase involved in cell wall biosynthesis
VAGRRAGAVLAPLRQPLRAELDGIPVTYVPFLAPPRPRSYASWGAWAAPTLAVALRRLRRRFPYDLVHAHYAAPAGDAVRRARPGAPLVVSVHGGDVLGLARSGAAGERAVRAGLGAARLVLANSRAIEERARALGATRTRVVHLGTDVAPAGAAEARSPFIVTVAHLVARKRHADALRALALLPELRWVVVGDGPERGALERLVRELGLEEKVEFRGQLPPAEAAAAMRGATAFVMPSTDEAFGVAYIEAMAAGVPAIGCRGEPGPEEIAATDEGMRLVPPGDPEALARQIRAVAEQPELRDAARATVLRGYTWEACGAATVAAYEETLR